MRELEAALTRAFAYIEENLNQSIHLESIATNAGYSLYHFHRIFRYIVGDSLKGYIRKRIMTEAALELTTTSHSTIDIAAKYGYESRMAFSRAFQNTYGITPSIMRKDNTFYSIREAMSSEAIVHKLQQYHDGLTPTIAHCPARHVFGLKVNVDENSHRQIPLLWSDWMRTHEKFPPCCYGICQFNEAQEFNYIIAESNSESTEFIEIPAGLYAVFRVEEPLVENVQKTWDQIYSVWLNNAAYTRIGAQDIEAYYFNASPQYAELYLPIAPQTSDTMHSIK